MPVRVSALVVTSCITAIAIACGWSLFMGIRDWQHALPFLPPVGALAILHAVVMWIGYRVCKNTLGYNLIDYRGVIY